MPFLTSIRIVVRAATQFSQHDGAQMSAALAYYALFSTTPLLLLAVRVAGLFFGEEEARAQVRTRLTERFGPETTRLITDWMDQAARPASGTLAAVVGIVLLLVGALGLFLHLRRCLCIIWQLEPPKGSGLLITLLNYLLAILAVVVVGLLLLVSLAASTAAAVLIHDFNDWLPGGAGLWRWIEWALSFFLLALFFAVVYRVLSGRQVPWHYLWYGAFVSAFLFTVGKTLISLYLAYTSTTSIYGAAGSLVVFLVWVYYSSQIAFFGAELIQARRTRAEWLPPAAASRR